MFRKDARQIYHTTPFDEIPWLRHGFGTRDSALLPGNWRLVSAHQIHSRRTLAVGAESGCVGEADALITARSGTLLTIRTADCLPILMVERNRRVVAAVHAGWRGSAAGIVRAVVERLAAEFSADVGEIQVAIGPGIGPCCYQVGAEVASRFGELFPELGSHQAAAMLDLAEANRRQLMVAGVRRANIYIGAPCTCCHPGEFYSYRRDGMAAGRMVSMIGILDRPDPAQH